MTGRTVLVTGAGGLLGTDLVTAFTDAGWEVTGTVRSKLDVGDREQVLGAIRALRPDVVVNAAAFAAVGACESEPERAFADNALAVRHVAEACRRTGAHLCTFSTDYVFSGDAADPYTEWDEVGPRSVYGRSKLAGEREAGPDATVVRTSWLNGRHGGGFVRTVLRLAADPDRPLAFVDDQWGCPTLTVDLAGAVVGLMADQAPGIHHVTNQDATTWHGLAVAVLAAAGENPDRARPIPTAELDPPRPAPRPANSVLDNAVLRLSGRPLLRSWREGLGDLVDAMRSTMPA